MENNTMTKKDLIKTEESLGRMIIKTEESLGRMIKRSFDGVDKRFDGVDKRLNKLKKNQRMMISKLDNDVVYRNEFEELDDRVVELEQAVLAVKKQ